MGPVSRQLWDDRGNHPTVIEAEFRGEKGREWLTTWLPARAYDNGIFIVFSNGVGVDSDEIRTGNSMIIDPYGRILAHWNCNAYTSVSFITNRRRTGVPASRLTSLPPFHATTRSISSP